MMETKPLIAILGSDLYSWEREVIQSHLASFNEFMPVSQFDLGPRFKNYFKKDPQNAHYWVISRNWPKTGKYLKLSYCEYPIYLSALSHQIPNFIFSSYWKKIFEQTKNFKFVCHSPLSFRFFSEMMGLSESKLINLPFGIHSTSKSKKDQTKPVTIGSLTQLNTEANLAYLVSVAHYLKDHFFQFKINLYGSGKLELHFLKMLKSLNLEDCFNIKNKFSCNDVSEVDIFLFHCLENDHFIPLQLAASHGTAVVSTDIMGVGYYIQNEQTGYILPVNDVNMAGSVIGNLIENQQLRERLGRALQQDMSQRFSLPMISEQYKKAFFDKQAEAKTKAA